MGGARARAKARGLPYDLRADTAAELKAAEGAPCPACGTPMLRRTAHAPSLDRVANDDGYVRRNLAILCKRCNMRKGDMTSSELQRLADWLRGAEASRDFAA